MRRAFACMCLAALAWSASPVAADSTVKQGAGLYHQGRYDSATAILESCLGQGQLKRRDSLALFQYLGMASARLGKPDAARERFRTLLTLDSLFQFPRNEDPAVLDAFARARAEKAAPAAIPEPAAVIAPPVAAVPPAGAPIAAPATAPAAKLSFADSGTGLAAATPELRTALPPPDRITPETGRRGIGLAMGAVPLGGGWLARSKIKHGATLALLQAGGIALSMYASGQISSRSGDAYGTQESELDSVHGWQWVQGVSLSTAVGAYLFSLIASTGE